MAEASHPRSALTTALTERLLVGLMEDNVLRGKWAEEIVGHYLDGDVAFAEQWNWYDLRWDGKTVSVKHSVNSTARFSVKTSAMVFDAELGLQRGPKPYTVGNPEGWLGHEKGVRQHWCDLYVFAWLPERSSVEVVLDPSSWRFIALSRADMYRIFPVAAMAKTVGCQALEAMSGQSFVEGAKLADLARERLVASPPEGLVVPDPDRRRREQIEADLAAKP